MKIKDIKIIRLAFMTAVIGILPTLISAQDVTLAEGTPLSIVLGEDVSSKTAERGDAIEFTVEEDLIVDGKVLIRKGTAAKGTVIYAEKGGYMGKSGKLAVQVESTTTVDGGPLPLIAAKGGEGNSKAGTVIALSYIAGPFALLKKGGETVVKAGTKITVYTAESRSFRVESENLVAATPIIASLSGELVTVYIYRQKKMVGGALEPSVFLDGIELARMDNGRYFVLKVAPGKHTVHMTDNKKVMS